MFDVPKLLILRRLLRQIARSVAEAIEIVEADLRERGALPDATTPCRESGERRDLARS